MINEFSKKEAPILSLAGMGGGAFSRLFTSSGAAGPVATRSLRFNNDDQASLSRTPSSAGNRKTFTYSCWFKRAKIARGYLFSVWNSDTDSEVFAVNFSSSHTLNIDLISKTLRITDQVFKDPAAWYHLVIAVDTTQSTASDRLKVYINGSQVTSFSTNNNFSQDDFTGVNGTFAHQIGRYFRNSSTEHPFDGYMADIYLIDGSQLLPTRFGAFDDNGVWQAAGYSGSFGTNGFHLPFLDATNTTTIAEDSSGKNNDFTANNISVTAGAGNDSMFDVPTNGDTSSESGAGGEVSGCYATLNPLQAITNSPTNGNLDIGGSSTGTYTKSVSTIYIDPEDTTGYYCEFTVVTTGTNPGGHIQLIPQLNVTNNGKGETGGVGLGMRGSGAGNRWYKLTDQSSGTDTGVSHAADQVIGVAVKNGKLYMAINNTWVLSGNPATESNPLYSSLSGLKGFLCGTLDGSWQCNWGQRPFTYSAPTGYRPVSSASLPTATVLNGRKYFDTSLWTGNGSTQSITSLEFSPDWVWIKNRGSVENHSLNDTVRGANKQIQSSTTTAETTHSNQLTSFDSSGFSLGSSSQVNENNVAHVAWCWDAGSSTVTNTSGSVNSSVRANPTAGFSIAAFTVSSDGNVTVGHGLGAIPEFIIVKRRTGTEDWYVHHTSLASDKMLKLNSTGGISNSDVGNSTLTNTLFNHAANTGDHIAYSFTSVAGYSAFGSYTGNGSSDGPFVHTGFSVAFVMFKRSDSTGDWIIFDNKRNTSDLDGNFREKVLYPNKTTAEETSANGDTMLFLSNGFKLNNVDYAYWNASGGTYIWAAFAENPFQANGGLAR